MANDQSDTPVATVPADEAVTAEAGQAVEGAVAATSEQADYAEPSADRKADLQDDLFGDEAQYITETEAPADGQAATEREPQGVIASHP
ncbi:hypothetical protein GCM10009639_02380 [Kitasatospora putterlickiae]|uniref:Uncharacterized protein n=1 Tax=Kitasatospora putterlickiae TaxID=221725 RepID=A0ABP4I6H5_9ACTN